MSWLVSVKRREVQLAKPRLTSQLVAVKMTAVDRALRIESNGEKDEQASQRYRPVSCHRYDGEDQECRLKQMAYQ